MQGKTTTGTLGAEEVLKEIMREAKEKNVTLKPRNLLFRHGTTKHTDSRLLDFIHGSSPLFGSMRAKLDNNLNRRACFFCNIDVDSPGHQIFDCQEVKDETYHVLKESSQDVELPDLMAKIFVPSSAGAIDMQRVFIDRVAFLADQQESMQDGYSMTNGDT